MKTKKEIVKEIKSLLLENNEYWEDAIWGLADHGYYITGITSQAGDTLRWTEETLYIYRFEKDYEVVNVGIMVEEGLTEDQEGRGIIDVFEVMPRIVERTIWERY